MCFLLQKHKNIILFSYKNIHLKFLKKRPSTSTKSHEYEYEYEYLPAKYEYEYEYV